MGIQNYGGFVTAVILFQSIPGPGTMIILNSTARHGTGMGMRAVFGTLAGDFLYMLAAALGLASIMESWPIALTVARWAGIVYLLQIGLRLVHESMKRGKPAKAVSDSGSACFRQALSVCMANPNAILFFMTFFPLFLSTGAPRATLAFLMVHVLFIGFLYQTGLVVAGNAVAIRMSRRPLAGKAALWLCGIAFIGFGIKMARAMFSF
jgi:threonine/homoserine/homoserine lactone efflux protein